MIATAGGAWLYLRPRPLGPPSVTPAPGQRSVSVGDVVQFAASASNARRITWSLWGRPVSRGSTWSYVPGPEEAGWQQISVEILGDAEQRAVRTWDLGVLPAVPPGLADISPPLGVVTIPSGGAATFRASARLPAARDDDRMTFEWSVDGGFVLREERSGGEGASEFVVPSAEPGTHRVALRVSEGKRSASIAEWALEVRPAALRQDVAPPPSPEDAGPVPSPRPPPPAPEIVALAGPRTVELGGTVSFGVRIEPANAGTEIRWTVDGRRVAAASKPEFEYEPDTPGRHRVAVSVVFGDRSIFDNRWFVTVKEPAAVARADDLDEPSNDVPEEAPTPSTIAEAAPTDTRPVEAQEAPTQLAKETASTTLPRTMQADVRAWMAEYASAWSRKDVAALREMGQIRTASEVEKLEQYFRSVGELRVDVQILSVKVDGDRAQVEFERTDTITDLQGRKQELKLPPITKEIERTSDGLRFTIVGTRLQGVL